jgi:hypothetical protein
VNFLRRHRHGSKQSSAPDAAPFTRAIPSIGRVVCGSLTVTVLAAAQLLVSTGTASAAMDDEQTIVDSVGDSLNIQQWETFLDGVTPLDRNPLTREWFQTGRVQYKITGPNAASFAGTLELGYQVSAPWALGFGINFTYQTPNLLLDGGNLGPTTFNPLIYSLTPNLVPGAQISASLTNGPGVQEVATFAVAVSGPTGAVRVANAHGTITGVAGGLVLRPYARISSKSNANDTVSTYGNVWDMN